jgi:hypothetical protein
MPYVGMPWVDFVVFFMAAMESLVFRWQFLIPLTIVFVFSLTMYRRDYNAGRCFVCWMKTSGKHLATHQLGGTFISPAPGRGFRGIIHYGE